jgi:hypothetical protein
MTHTARIVWMVLGVFVALWLLGGVMTLLIQPG